MAKVGTTSISQMIEFDSFHVHYLFYKKHHLNLSDYNKKIIIKTKSYRITDTLYG